jgi:hypothetical protein
MIWMQPTDDHPIGDIAHAAPLDLATRPFAPAIAIQQQRDHHRRIERCPAMPVGPVRASELSALR